jgi:hypothetical protein
MNPNELKVIRILLSQGSMEIPDKSYVAVSNRLGCSTVEAAQIVRDLQERNLVELISDFDGELSAAPIRSSWRWNVPADCAG